MLKRRSKRRYLSIIHAGESSASVNAITKRFCELFGTIAAEKAAIRLVQQGENESIIKCRLDYIENVLVAIQPLLQNIKPEMLTKLQLVGINR